jgi:hypothetical protein
MKPYLIAFAFLLWSITLLITGFGIGYRANACPVVSYHEIPGVFDDQALLITRDGSMQDCDLGKDGLHNCDVLIQSLWK